MFSIEVKIFKGAIGCRILSLWKSACVPVGRYSSEGVSVPVWLSLPISAISLSLPDQYLPQ